MTFAGQVLIDCARQEEDDYNRRSDPHRPIQVRVAFEDVEEVLTWIDGCSAAAQDFVGVDIKGLRVKGESPEIVFTASRARRRSCWAGQEGGVIGRYLIRGA